MDDDNVLALLDVLTDQLTLAIRQVSDLAPRIVALELDRDMQAKRIANIEARIMPADDDITLDITDL